MGHALSSCCPLQSRAAAALSTAIRSPWRTGSHYGYAAAARSAGPPWGQQPDPRATISATVGTARDMRSLTPAISSPASSPRRPAGYGETDAEFDEAMAEEEESASRTSRSDDRRRAGRAIGLGGGMAYAYKTFSSPRARSGDHDTRGRPSQAQFAGR
jgi:hypothetical protein